MTTYCRVMDKGQDKAERKRGREGTGQFGPCDTASNEGCKK